MRLARIQLYGTGHGPANSVCPAASTDTTVLLDLGYTYSDASGHNNGNVASIANNAANTRSQSFTYDPLNRISSALTTGTHSNDPANCWGENYGYDPWGNLLSIAPTTNSAYTGCVQESGFNFTGAMSTNNRIATAGYAYDAAGNLTTNPGVGTQTFNAENQLVSAGGQTYLYDGDGKRVEKASGSPLTANKLYWYGASSNPVIETDGAGNFQYRYISFNGMRVSREEANDWVDHYGLDALGNVRYVYGNNGTWDISDYYPFGGERAVSSSTNNRYKFTGKERDSESGNDNFGARYNSSSLGRFMSPDDSEYSEILELPQTWNKYAYVYNRPTYATDPNGKCPPCIGAIVGGVVEGGFDLGKQLWNNGGHFQNVKWREVGANALGGAVAGATGGRDRRCYSLRKHPRG